MSEVRATHVSIPPSSSPITTKPAAGAASPTKPDEVNALPESGQTLPPKEAPAADKSTKESRAVGLDQAVTEINDYVQSVQRDLHFSVDEDSGLTIVRVRDKESGELIRQIPEDIFLSLAQNLKDNQPINLFDAHG